MTNYIQKAGLFVHEHGPRIAVEILVNFVAPFLIYNFAKQYLGDVHALFAAAGPPIAWSLVEFARKRRIDAVSMLALTGIVLSLLAFIGGGSARFLQLREALVTGLIGLVFLGSAAIGRPLVYQLARASMRRKSASELSEFEALSDNIYFRRSMTIMTLVWGFGLIGHTALASALVFAISIRAYLLVSPILGYGTMGALGLWTFWYVRRQKKRGATRQAAELAAREAALEPSPA